MADEPRPYQLYWYKAASSLAPMAVLEETGATYEAVEIDAAAGEHKGAAYRQIHPLGLIPALRLPDGRMVFESAGIVHVSTISAASQPDDGYEAVGPLNEPCLDKRRIEAYQRTRPLRKSTSRRTPNPAGPLGT